MNINCSELGAGEITFTLDSSKPDGTYKMLYDVQSDYPSINHCIARVYNPTDVKAAVPVQFPKNPFKSLVTLKTMMNKQGQNDYTKSDEL